jgi:hypothetical protein
MIERAYTCGEALGVSVWCEDEAGPYGTVPYPGASWQPEGEPARLPHEYFREGTAKMLTLLQPQTGQVRVKGVTNTRNETLHSWLRSELSAILVTLPAPGPVADPQLNRDFWESWREGLTVRVTLPEELPPLRLILVMDNLTGHKNPHWLLWCFANGILPIYTPLSGSWLNMAESIQRILKRRSLDGCHPHDVQTIIDRLESVARGWNAHPTPFIWNGKRRERRDRGRTRRLHRLGGSGAASPRPIERLKKWRSSCQVTH